MDVGNDQNEDAQQNHDLDGIIEKELDAAADFTRGIQTQCRQTAANGLTEPSHAKDLILDKIPHGT